jgi:hypothetical protein
MIPNPRQRDIRVPCTQHLQPTQFSTTIPQNFISKAHPSLRKPQTFPTRLSNFDNFQPSNTDKKTSTCPTNQSGTPVLEPTAKARAAGLSSLFSPLLSSPLLSYFLILPRNYFKPHTDSKQCRDWRQENIWHHPQVRAQHESAGVSGESTGYWVC